MSDFILPGDIHAQAQQYANDSADGWHLLMKMCVIKQFPMDMAESLVVEYMHTAGLSEVEALRKVYHEVAKS